MLNLFTQNLINAVLAKQIFKLPNIQKTFKIFKIICFNSKDIKKSLN